MDVNVFREELTRCMDTIYDLNVLYIYKFYISKVIKVTRLIHVFCACINLFIRALRV